MKWVALAFLATLMVAAENPQPGISYFKQTRDVSVPIPDRQNYFVVDAAIWSHARPDLSDLRLYDGNTQLPYQLVAQKSAISAQEAEAKILNLGQHGDHTEFDLDVSPVSEYNRIHLTIDRKDFLITAMVEGRDSISGGASVPWPQPSTLFDFTRENLGSNQIITVPTWSFRYVHVRLSPGILPKEVQRATIAYLQEKKPVWTEAGACQISKQEQHNTVVTCDVPPAMPIDRIQFLVPASRVNFRRPVSVANEKGMQVAAGSISRIRMVRGGTTAVSEDLVTNVFGDYSGRFTITIDNGDDPPIPFDRIQPQSLERRVYFEPQGKSGLNLYYGDEKLAGPVYDYAKFFREDPNAAVAQLSAESSNVAYTGRPDDRPWSERHRAILWVAMLLAVAVLALLALRGLSATH